MDYSNCDTRDKVRALANTIGFRLGEIGLEYEAESTSAEISPIEEEWPYEHVQPGEVEQDLFAHEAKLLRQEPESHHSKIDDWACDECEERKAVSYHPPSDQHRCRVCAGFDEGGEALEHHANQLQHADHVTESRRPT